MFDGLSYTAYAKHILTTGDWKALHYDVRNYPLVYGIPPLAIWVQALIYKTFGFAESITRVFPATCALLSVAGAFIFTRLRFGLGAAFWTSIALITSTRFIKWGTNFYLDGIAGFFVFTSFIIWLWTLSEKNHRNLRDNSLAFISGLFLTASFMTKGFLAFPFAVAIGLAPFFYFGLRSFKLTIFLLLGTVLPILLWIYFGEGMVYLRHYFSEAPVSRGSVWCYDVWDNIKNVWLPWWPIFAFSYILVFKKLIKRDWLFPLMGAATLSLPMALTLNYHYFEHYSTSFYPFAAMMVGVQVSAWIKKDLSDKYLKFAFTLAVVIAVYLGTIAPNINKQKDYPAMLWLPEIRTMPVSEQKKIKTVIFSRNCAELWLNLAAILARTDWMAIGNFEMSEPAIESSLLIVKKGERPDSTWEKIPQLYVEGFEFYGPKGLFQF